MYLAALLPILFACCLTLALASPGRETDRTQLWEKPGKDILWGFHNMYAPALVREPEGEYPFKMWFFGWATADCNPGYQGCDAIFHARSKDLDHWEVYAGEGRWDVTMDPKLWVPVITADDKRYDQWHNGDPTVVRLSGRYYMALSSTGWNVDGKRFYDVGEIKDGTTWVCCVMGATSQDGIHWQKTSAPILIWRDGAAQKESYHGPGFYGEYARPCLRREGDRWRLWFDYSCPGKGCSMAYAENEGDFMDPKQWRVLRADDNPLLPNWPNPNVIKVGKLYYGYADPGNYPLGKGWAARQIFEAVSKDGLDWEVLGYIAPDPDTPACHVPEAMLLEREGKQWIYLFYACQIGGDPYDFRYNKIRYMRRPAL